MEPASGPFRPLPGTPVAWPADWGPRFALFVDTEEEFDWTAPLDPRARSVTAIAALPDAHRRLVEGGALPGYLVDHPVATDPGSVEVLRTLAAAGATIGAQLHPWVNPPAQEDWDGAASFVGTLPRDVEAAKLDVLTGAITSAVGTAPRLYRAGRYGIGPNTSALLAQRGYRIDTSMRSQFDYSDLGGPDFGGIDAHAFRLNEDVIELPLTTVYTGWARRAGARLHRLACKVPHGRGLLARSGALSRVPLTPEGVPRREALEAIRVALGEGVRLLNLSFHSPSLVAGHTPYVRDARDLATFHAWWDAVLALLARRNVRAIDADALIAASA